jgi:hypothetical protein
MINSCFILHNNALNKLVALDQPNISNAWAWVPYDELCDSMWSFLVPPPICTLFCSGVGCGHIVQPFGSMSQLHVFVCPVRVSAWHTLISMRDMLWQIGWCFLSAPVFPFFKDVHHICNCSCDIRCALYTSTYGKLISTRVTFDHVSNRHACCL